MDPARVLSALERGLAERGRDAATRRANLLSTLAGCSLPRSSHVGRLHEALCFLRAYPDNARVLTLVESMLAKFASRQDLRTHRSALADTGIVGTEINYAFFWPMAAWLAERWPAALTVDWPSVEEPERFDRLLQLLVLYAETPALDTQDATVAQWFARFKGEDETDAQFFIERLRRLPMSDRIREAMFDELVLPLKLSPTEHTPSRTHAYYPRGKPVFQARAFPTRKPTLRRALAKPPPRVRTASRREGEAMVELARGAMLTRGRDLDAISYGNPDDAYLIDAGDGFLFACFGVLPDRRLMLETVYLFIILKNGVPVGYFQASTLFGASELNFNVFDPWRGAESAAIYARAVSVAHHMCGSDVFAIDSYQIGNQNAEALRTGAFWFYYKMGFRPEHPDVRQLVREELVEIKKGRGHRTSRATLKKMAAGYLYFYVNGRRDDVVGKVSYGDVTLVASHNISKRFGADREAATAHYMRVAAKRLGVKSTHGFSPSEHIAWERWSPLVACLDGVERWSTRDKKALVAVIRAKGARREMEYLRRCARHGRLRRALIEGASSGDVGS